MTYKLIDGKKHSKVILEEIKQCVAAMVAKGERVPGLLTVIVGDEKSSEVYVSMKRKRAKAIGFKDFHEKLPWKSSQADLLDLILKANENPAIDGILVQLPLPAHIHAEEVIRALNPEKDVDGFHPQNIGKLFRQYNSEVLAPCTPKGIYELLLRENIQTSGKRVVIIGRSNLVGKPLACILSQPRRVSQNTYGADASVTLLHSKSRKEDVLEYCRRADILIAAAGIPKFVTADMVQEKAVVIDVGIHKIRGELKDGKAPAGMLVGDVDFDSVKHKVSAITPVPGGVGPMTIAMLMQNTMQARKLASLLVKKREISNHKYAVN